MTFTKWKIKDNAETQLQTSITSTATTIVLASGGGAKMPDVPCILTLNARSGQEVIKLEKVKVTEKINDNLKVDRGYGGTTAQSFDAGDYVSCFVTVELIQDLQDEVTRLETSKKDDFDFADIPLSSLKDGPSETPANNEYLKWNETTERYEPGIILANDVPMQSAIIEEKYYAGEQLKSLDSLYVSKTPTYSMVNTRFNIGDTVDRKRVGTSFITNGNETNQKKIALRYSGLPSINLGYRIETDIDGKPSGILYNNLYGTINVSSLDTVGKEITITLPGTLGIIGGIKLHIVLFVGEYGNETVNASNYYQLGCLSQKTRTTTINSYNTSRINPANMITLEYFPGTTLSSIWDNIAGSTINNNLIVTVGSLGAGASFGVGTKGIISKDTYDYDFLSVQGVCNCQTDKTAYSQGEFQSLLCIYFDAQNYIYVSKKYTFSFGTLATPTNELQIIKGGSVVGSESVPNGISSIKIEYDRSANTVKMLGHNGTQWTQLGMTKEAIFTGNPKILTGLSGIVTTANNGYLTYTANIDDLFICNYSCSKLTPETTEYEKIPYISSSGIAGELFAKTNAQYSYMMPDIIRLSKENYVAGDMVGAFIGGNISWGTPLQQGLPYYVANKYGEISVTRGNNIMQVGVSLSTSELSINKKLISIPITVGTSPFIRQNTSGNALQYYVSGGTVNPIQISKDGTTYITQSTATGYIGTLAPGDYLKVTYTVLPTITYSEL